MADQRTVRAAEQYSPPARDKSLHSAACDIQSAISGCPYALVRELTCECGDGVLIVSGKLPSYYLKQVAIALVTKHLRLGVQLDLEIEVT